MTTENEQTYGAEPADVTDDLGEFAKEMFGGGEAPEPAEEKPEAAEQEESETGEAEGETTDEEESQEEKPVKPKRTTADRIKKLNAEYREEQRQRMALEARLAELEKTALPKKEESATVSVSEAPNAENYRYGELDPQYMRDMAEFAANQKIEQFRTELRKEQEETQQRSAVERQTAQLRETADKIETAGKGMFPDFEEVVIQGAQNGDWRLTQEIFELAAETSVAPEALYYLASYPDEAERVASLPPRQQAMWFGKLEAEIKTAAATPKARRITQAPAPPSNLPRGAGAKSAPRFDDLDDPRALLALEREFGIRK